MTVSAGVETKKSGVRAKTETEVNTGSGSGNMGRDLAGKRKV